MRQHGPATWRPVNGRAALWVVFLVLTGPACRFGFFSSQGAIAVEIPEYHAARLHTSMSAYQHVQPTKSTI